MGEATTIPADHEVRVFHMTVEPNVTRTPGNVILANFGVASDDADAELENILRDVDNALTERANATLINLNRRVRLDELFAPAALDTLQAPSPISWLLHEGTVGSMMASEGRRTALLAFMHRAAAAGVPQAAYFIDRSSPAVIAFAQVMQGLDILLRQPEEVEGDLSVALEVKRPDGRFTLLTGNEIPLEGLPERFKPGELRSLPADAFAARVRELQIDEHAVALRSPRLRQLMIDLDTKSDPQAMQLLITQLLTRGLPVFLMRGKDREGIAVRTFGQENALPAYADLFALDWAADDMGKGRGSYLPGAVDFGSLLVNAAKSNVGVAVCTYRDRKTPMYAIIPAALVGELAKNLVANV